MVRQAFAVRLLAVVILVIIAMPATSIPNAAASQNGVIYWNTCIDGSTVKNGAYVRILSQTALAIKDSWSWGDGPAVIESLGGLNQSSTGGEFALWQSHTYSSGGTYMLSLTVFWNDGTNTTSSEYVTVPSALPSNCVTLTVLAGDGGSVDVMTFYYPSSSVQTSTAEPGSPITLESFSYFQADLVAKPTAGFRGWHLSGSGNVISACVPYSGGDQHPIGREPSSVDECPRIDILFDGAVANATFVPLAVTKTSCIPATIVVGTTTTCTAVVTGAAPTGTVDWNSSSEGEFSPSSCALSSGACSVSYTPSQSTSPTTINATYQGDARNGGSSGVFSLTVDPPLSAKAILPSNPTVGKGELIQLGANPSGGIPPYAIAWYVAPGPGICSTSDSLVSTGPTYSPLNTASAYYCYVATDSEVPPVNASSLAELVTVSSLPVPTVSLSCSRSSVPVGSTIACKVTVQRPVGAATGKVSWSSSGPGIFLKTACNLTRGACSVRFMPTAPSSAVTLTASYSGDSKSSPWAGTYSLSVTMKATKTAVSCTPKSAVAGSSMVITCTAVVTGYSPTGEVSWSQSGTGSVSFASTTCTLTSVGLTQGTCSVTMTGTTAGKVAIQGAYTGDSNNKGSSRRATLTIKKAT